MILSVVLSFIFGVFIGGITLYMVSLKKEASLKEELIKLKAISDSESKLQEIIKRDFVQLANETIKNEQEDLRKQNREAIEEKILPLTKELNEFKQRVQALNDTGIKNSESLKVQLETLEKNNSAIKKEAENLVNALTKNQNVKGSYGENLLDTILQSCGMQEGVHYTKQFVTKSTSLKDDETHTVRPDVVINLPDNRHLIIDSKVTLTSYLEYIEDNTKLGNFKSEVKKRINDLADKNYQNAGDLSQPDFVLMYMPVESSVNLLYEDRELMSQAYKSNIIIVGTASLLATIRLVNQLFSQQKQAESINMIVKAGSNLYDTFVQFCDDLVDLHRKLDELSSKFTTTINRFKRNNKNKPSLFSQVNELKNYGIISTKEIPSVFLTDNSEEDDVVSEQEEVLVDD